VHLVCRNPETAEKAKEEIINETSNDKIFVHILDLSNIRAIHEVINPQTGGFPHQKNFVEPKCLLFSLQTSLSKSTVA